MPDYRGWVSDLQGECNGDPLLTSFHNSLLPGSLCAHSGLPQNSRRAH